MKRFFALILTLSMLLAICPLGSINAFAETYSGTCGDNVAWSLDTETGTLTISGTGDMEDYGSYYDAEYNDFLYKWSPWNDYIDSILYIVIEEGITSIGDTTFCYCSNLLDVEIPDSVTEIGYAAFRACVSLTSIDLPDSVTFIGGLAFNSCYGLTSVELPNSLTSISDAFSGCTSLTSITIPEGVTSIGTYAFKWCTGLTSVELPKSMTSIGFEAFYGCSALTGISIPESVTFIGDNAFEYCENIKSVYITDIEAWLNIEFEDSDFGSNAGPSISASNPLRYGADLYLNNTKVTDLVIPDGITEIGWCKFNGCTSITSVTIPKSVVVVGYATFLGCDNLTTVIYLGSEEDWNNIEIYYGNDKLLGAEFVFGACKHEKYEWKITPDNTKEKTCKNCGEVVETLGADEFIPNDVNGDNKINVFDYYMVKNIYFKGSTDEAVKKRADVNGDGRINVFDYYAVKTAYFKQ